MSSVQREATRAHRERARRRGLVRVEVQVDAEDGPLLRAVAGRLRDDGQEASRLRDELRRVLSGEDERSLLEELACELPDDVVDEALARPRDFGRPVEL